MAMPSCGSKSGLCEGDQEASVGEHVEERGRAALRGWERSRASAGGATGVCTGVARFSFLNNEPT